MGANQHSALQLTVDQVERALLEVAILSGNCSAASRRLKEVHGLDIAQPRLKNWVLNLHRTRYEEIRRDVVPKIHATIANEAEDLAVAYAEAERDTLKIYDPSRISGKDLPGAIRNLATAKAINLDKAQLLRGNPTEIIEKRNPQQILDGIAARFPQLVVDAEVVDDDERPALPPAA